MRHWRTAGLLLIVAMLAFAFSVVVRRPMLGVADNGDFWRITNSVGLMHDVPSKEFRHKFVRCTYLYTAPRWDKFMSSSALVAGAARVMMRAFHPAWFDLRALGLIYWLLLVAGVVYALYGGLPVLLVTLWVWILVDPNYLLTFNSFYTEPLLFLAVAGICALLASGAWHKRRRPFIVLCVLCLLAATTKSPYVLVPLTLLVAVVLVYEFWLPHRLVPLAVVAAIPPALLLLVSGAESFRYLARINQFNAIFFGVAQASATPHEALAGFDVPPAYFALAGKSFFQVDKTTYTEELAASLARIPRWKILAFYGAQPSALTYAANRVGHAMSRSRLGFQGHFEHTLGAQPAQYSVPWQFSLPRDLVLGGRPWLIAVLLVASAAWMVYRRLTGWHRGILTAQLFLWLTIVSQGVVAVLGDGFFGLERHLILARFAGDLLFATIVVDVVATFSRGEHEDVDRASRGRKPQRTSGRPVLRRLQRRRRGRNR
jgi:hypothetical protein